MNQSTYDFISGINEMSGKKVLKMNKTELRKEYMSLRKKLLRSVARTKRLGVYNIQDFTIPKIPKNITEGSIRKLKSVINEWNYIRGRGPVDTSKLRKNVTRARKKTLFEQLKGKTEAIQKEASKLRAKKQSLETKNANNRYWQQAQAEGYTMDSIPDQAQNEALGLIKICEDAIIEATTNLTIRTGDRARWMRVLENATSCEGWLMDAGTMEQDELFSLNLRFSKRYEQVATDLDNMIYDSDQVQYDEFTSKVLNYVTQEPTSMTEKERKRYDEIRAQLGDN